MNARQLHYIRHYLQVKVDEYYEEIKDPVNDSEHVDWLKAEIAALEPIITAVK